MTEKIEKATVNQRLDDALGFAEHVLESDPRPNALEEEAIIRAVSAVHFAAPASSVFVNSANEAHGSELRNFYKLEKLIGILKALKIEYEAGYLESMASLIHGEVFSDFLDMADELLEKGYKDAAAVIAGIVLEEHLRKLAVANGLEIVENGKHRNMETINADLKKAGVYPLNEQQQVTALKSLRNDAAHGHRDRYEAPQIRSMVSDVRAFTIRHPA